MLRLIKYCILSSIFCFVVYQAYKIYQQEIVDPTLSAAIDSNQSADKFISSEEINSPASSIHQDQARSSLFKNRGYWDNPWGYIVLLMAMGIVLWQNTSIRKYKGKIKNYNNELLEAKEKIRFLKHDLRQEINSRKESQQSLKNVLETLKEANTLKESFLANISHEVRTPLNGIMGFTTLIKEEARQIGNLKIENYSQIVSSSSERLLTFLNNVIDLSRIEAKELNIKSEQCNLVEITNQAIESQIFRANEKALKLIVEMDGFVPVMANHKYLSKVICNILDNAVKYTNHGFVKVGLYIPVGNKEVTLYIEDSGIGINPGFLAHIFEAFRQESTGMTRSFEGGGLALPLSKKLIEMMGGRLEIQSEKAKGTIVKIHLPKSEIPYDQEVVKSIQEKRVTLSKIDEVRFKTIFLIEDDSINGELIEAYLVGYAHVVVAKNGNEALKILDKLNLDQKQIDIFLMDINLPQEWDGIKLMKEIQNRWPVYEDVPFVAQTAYALEGDREKLIEKGFHDYISKPLKKKELIKCINNHLKNQVTLHNLTV